LFGKSSGKLEKLEEQIRLAKARVDNADSSHRTEDDIRKAFQLEDEKKAANKETKKKAKMEKKVKAEQIKQDKYKKVAMKAKQNLDIKRQGMRQQQARNEENKREKIATDLAQQLSDALIHFECDETKIADRLKHEHYGPYDREAAHKIADACKRDNAIRYHSKIQGYTKRKVVMIAKIEDVFNKYKDQIFKIQFKNDDIEAVIKLLFGHRGFKSFEQKNQTLKTDKTTLKEKIKDYIMQNKERMINDPNEMES
tara:strand:- start:52 stop:813 length:762 start_codon:yes stop_codon:yes gene_type:complete